MPKIFVIRHGEDKDNQSGILNGRRNMPLTNKGREQAEKVAKLLVNKNINIIYSSPLKRSKETAEIIAKKLQIKEVKVEKDLIERDLGALTGKRVEDIPKLTDRIIKTDKVNYFLEAKGAESFPALKKRAKILLEKIIDRHPNDNIVLVTHGAFGKMIRAAFYHWGWRKGLQTPHFGNSEILELSK